MHKYFIWSILFKFQTDPLLNQRKEQRKGCFLKSLILRKNLLGKHLLHTVILEMLHRNFSDIFHWWMFCWQYINLKLHLF